MEKKECEERIKGLTEELERTQKALGHLNQQKEQTIQKILILNGQIQERKMDLVEEKVKK